MHNGYFQGSENFVGNDFYPTPDRLLYNEFLTFLKPLNHHVMLELSALISICEGTNGNGVSSKFLQGISIERRQLEEEHTWNKSFYKLLRRRDINPGIW